jgi:hypothetical protein
MTGQDYIDGFNAAKLKAEKVAQDEIAAAKKELDLNRVKLAAGQTERTQVRLTYAEKIAKGIRKLRP